MPKRRRTLGGEDGSSEEPETSVGKRRRLRHLDTSESYQELYDLIRNHKTEDGRLLCETFIRAPKKRSSADYYEIVSSPIDLLKVQQKIKADEYSGLDALSSDVELLVTNAKSYYKRTSQEYRDACALWDIFCDAKQRLASDPVARDEDSRSTDGGDKDSHDDDDNLFEDLFAAVMTSTDAEGRFLSSMFQLLPSKSRYPDYYKIIHDPIDLKTIACRIQNVHYQTLNDLEKDLLLLVKNAKNYNEPGSQIYKDAAQLRKIIVNKKVELDQRKLTPAKTSERISLIINSGNGVRSASVVRRPSASRAKRMASGQKWSAITAALRYESDSEESTSSSHQQPGRSTPQQTFSQQDQSSFQADETEDGATNDSGPEDAAVNPQWLLYEAVKGYQSPPGYFMAEPFFRLPSKKLYPDYFREIKQPMSLFKICSRIKSTQYSSPMEVVDDMNIMFENAKRYNRPDSKIFKDAVKLQKVMQAKARELINFHMKQESESDGECADEEEEVSRSSSSTGGVKRGPKPKKLSLGGTILTPTEAKKYKKTTDFDVSLRKRLKILYKCMVDHEEYGRSLIPIFMEKPSPKDYPDYYEIISNPMDMKTIDWNIKNDKYTSEEQLVSDMCLMFSNCRHYNEEGSQIYRDANTLEQVLTAKVKELGPLFDPRGNSNSSTPTPQTATPVRTPGKRGPQPRRLTDLQHKLKTLHDTIRDYQDSKGRKLSTIFLKLPTKTDYPDYYEVIKRPMDLEKINLKMRNSQYESLEDMLSDFILMFDNACKYNEPDSQIYKDALSLQRIALQTKLELCDPEDGVPDVRALIQELLTNLFTSVYNHQDEEGRCFSDSVVELSEADPANLDPHNPQARPLTMDIIKRNLNRGCYRRLDHFQEDMFEVFERARMVTRTDSQAFEDSIELQSFFVRKRNELCKNGSVLNSPALLYSEADLQASVESLRAQKLPCEAQQEPLFENQQEKETKTESDVSSSPDSVIIRGQTYRIGDFVYVEPREKGMEPHIIHMEKLWRDENGEFWISGCWFYRPLETFHLATRKFLQKEVFKSDNYNSTPLNQVLAPCYVMCVKDYFKYRPEGFDDRDVYVCESRYSARCKSFKKIKIWGCCLNSGSKIIPREEPLIPIRVPSAFKDGVEKHRDDSMDFEDGDIAIIEKNKPNIVCDVDNPEDGATYYDQYNLPIGLYKLGDYCYIRTESEKTLIARIDQMWTDRLGNAYFHGPWFLSPAELPPTGTPRLFYKQELFMSGVEDTNPLLSVVGRCTVLDLKDYATCRPTEIPEEDIFICESRYIEAERMVRKFPKGLKKFQLSADVLQDEIYFFRNPVYPQKSEVINTNVGICRSSLFAPAVADTENEESNDMPPPSMPGGDLQVVGTPLSTGKKKGGGKRLVTGYILFASEVRKAVVVANPDRTFGDISRMIGTEWRNLPQSKKTDYEERAQKQNEEMAAREASGGTGGSTGGAGSGWDSYPHSPASLHGGSNNSNSNHGLNSQADSNKESETTTLWECNWDSCDFQFEELQDLVEHLLVETKGHIFQTYTNPKAGEYQCLWQNCVRIKRNVPPFPNIQRLLRHTKEVHIKSASKHVAVEARSKNFVASRKSSASPIHTSYSNSASQPVTTVAGYTPIKVPDPIFVATPPKPQRLLHSNTYIRYIEGLNTENRWVGEWDQQLLARKENTLAPADPPSLQRLPTHWLAEGATAHHGDVLSALWALRDFMLRDALGIAKIAS